MPTFSARIDSLMTPRRKMFAFSLNAPFTCPNGRCQSQCSAWPFPEQLQSAKHQTSCAHRAKETPSSILQCVCACVYINMFQSKCRNNVDTSKRRAHSMRMTGKWSNNVPAAFDIFFLSVCSFYLVVVLTKMCTCGAHHHSIQMMLINVLVLSLFLSFFLFTPTRPEERTR